MRINPNCDKTYSKTLSPCDQQCDTGREIAVKFCESKKDNKVIYSCAIEIKACNTMPCFKWTDWKINCYKKCANPNQVQRHMARECHDHNDKVVSPDNCKGGSLVNSTTRAIKCKPPTKIDTEECPQTTTTTTITTSATSETTVTTATVLLASISTTIPQASIKIIPTKTQTLKSTTSKSTARNIISKDPGSRETKNNKNKSDNESGGLPFWIWIVVAIVVIILLILVVVAILKRDRLRFSKLKGISSTTLFSNSQSHTREPRMTVTPATAPVSFKYK